MMTLPIVLLSVGALAIFAVFMVVLLVWVQRMVTGTTDATTRRVMKTGVAAEATVLSEALISTGPDAGKLSVVYEIRPPSGAPFRARGVAWLMSGGVGTPSAGQLVKVQYDPTDGTVIFMGPLVDPRVTQAQLEAARLAREEELLRGG